MKRETSSELPQKIVHVVEHCLPHYEMRWASFYVLKRNFPRYSDLTGVEAFKKWFIPHLPQG